MGANACFFEFFVFFKIHVFCIGKEIMAIDKDFQLTG